MKKVLLGILLIVPIIIVATVVLTTQFISSTVYLPVDSVELNYSEYDVELKYSPDNVVNFLEATVYPKFAQNKNIIWSIEEQRSTTPGVYTEYQIENDGVAIGAGVEPNDVAYIDEKSGDITLLGIYGNFYVKATTEDGNKTATCFVTVYGDKVTSIKISASKTTLDIGDKCALNKIFTPADPSDKKVTWSSSNESVAVVDNNGVVTAKSFGESVITVTSNDGGFTDSVTIRVNDGPFKIGGTVYTSNNEVAIDSVTTFPIDSAIGATIDSENNRIILTANSATLTISGKTLTIIKVDSNAVIIENKDVIVENLSGVLKNGDIVYLYAKYLDSFNSSTPNVRFVSSDIEVATIAENGGEITILKDSSRPVTFSIYSGTTLLDSVTFEKVVTPIVSLTLELNATDSAKGIASETVYGTKNIDGTSFEMPINVKRPKSLDVDNLIFTLDDGSIGSFTGNVLRFSGDFTGKKTFTILVTAKYPMYSDYPVTASYKMTVVDGVNVNSSEEYLNAIKAKKVIALQDNIEIPLTEKYNEVYASIYGNGHMICYDQEELKETLNAEHGTDNEDLMIIRASNVTLENLTLRHGAYIEGEDLSQWADTRRCLFVYGWFSNREHEDEYFENINVKYCIFEQANTLVEVDGAYCNFDGCIFRNSSMVELYVPMTATCEYGRLPTEIGVKNCVFTNCYTVPIMMQTDVQGEVFKYSKDATIEDAVNDGYIWRHITFDGFIDVYNWFELDNFKVVSFKTGNTTIDKILDGINTIIADEISQPENESLRHYFEVTDASGNTETKTYYHLAIAVDGLTTPIPDDLIVGYDEVGFYRYETHLKSTQAILPFPFYIYGYKEGCYTIGPDSSVEKDFKESASLYRDLREGRA